MTDITQQKDALHNELKRLRKDMRGLNPNTALYQKLIKKSEEIGAKLSKLKQENAVPA